MIALEPDSPLVQAVHPSPNIEERKGGARPTILLLHYTGMASAEKAVWWLAHKDSKVSCHYVIDEAGAVTQMVAESMRAWHAGVSHWAGESDINSHSIGIEIQNPGHADGYPDFPLAQMRGVAALGRDIIARHRITPARILAHSDVAPGRKIDPGEKFAWAYLARHGVGHWVRPTPVSAHDEGLAPGGAGEVVETAQQLLRSYGYGIEISGVLDERTHVVVAAFQRHFRPARVDGRLDRSTLSTLRRLIAALPGHAPERA